MRIRRNVLSKLRVQKLSFKCFVSEWESNLWVVCCKNVFEDVVAKLDVVFCHDSQSSGYQSCEYTLLLAQRLASQGCANFMAAFYK